MLPSLKLGRHHFQGQHENEQVLRIIHRHWFNIVIQFIFVVLCSFFILGSLSALPLLFPDMIDAGAVPFFHFIQNTLFLFLWLFGFLVWIDYYFDVWIITNERIVNIEQKGLFNRHISELRFSRVQDVTASVDGLVPTMLNFGDVYVQTASEEDHFIFRQVGDPFAVKDEVMRLARQATRDDMQGIVTALNK
ncbi:MAG: PH domain-containing protein [Candidatus Moranbacteria bacterium]|nr:PH domain-containing protein [Candidatus Moranbacteria bacterium]